MNAETSFYSVFTQ